jgi:hypothetical protein
MQQLKYLVTPIYICRRVAKQQLQISSYPDIYLQAGGLTTTSNPYIYLQVGGEAAAENI